MVVKRKRGEVETGSNPVAVRKASRLFSPLRTRRAFEEISAEIKRMIFSGVLKPGDRLPSETDLGSQFGVSRQTVREALRRLELAGFIVMQKGASGGPRVVDTILNSISDSFLDAFQMKKATTEELTKARLEVEKMVLKNVFGVITKEDVGLIRENLREAKKKLEQGIAPFGDDLNFHKLLAKATHNYVFVIMLESLMAVVAHFMSFLNIGREASLRANKAHKRILDSIERGDEAGAQVQLEKHILEADRAYLKCRKQSRV